MGLDVKNRLVVGCRIEDVVNKEVNVTQVKKFNPDTGEPYFVDNTEKVLIFGNRRLTEREFEELFEEKYPEPEEPYLKFFCTGCEVDNEIIGMEIEEVENDDIIETDVKELIGHAEHCLKLLQEYGLNPPINIFVVPYFSY